MARTVSEAASDAWERFQTERWFWGPSLVLFFAVFIGTSVLPGGTHGVKTFHRVLISKTNQTDMKKSFFAWPHENFLFSADNFVVAEFGPLLTVPLVVPSCWAWLRREPGECQRSLTEIIIGQEGPGRVARFFWYIIIVRVVLYLPVRWSGLNELFSDHVFLVCSLVAQIQLTQGVHAVREDDNPCHACLRRAELWYCCWLLLMLVVEVIATCYTYHTREACWLASVVGTFVFTSAALWAANGADGARGAGGGEDHMPYSKRGTSATGLLS